MHVLVSYVILSMMDIRTHVSMKMHVSRTHGEKVPSVMV